MYPSRLQLCFLRLGQCMEIVGQFVHSHKKELVWKHRPIRAVPIVELDFVLLLDPDYQ